MNDVANVSTVIGARFKFNTIELTKAALQAKALGLSMDEINGVASNLLNFEDSISAELEAELLTGREINLEQERLLALQGKTGELAEKLKNNEEVRLAFQTDNVLIQEAQAKAMGMTLEQLSKVFYQQEMNRLSAEQFKNMYGEQTYEQLKQLEIQQKFQKPDSELYAFVGIKQLETWKSTADFTFEVNDETNVSITLSEKCFVGLNPCMEYIGPKPR
jgi:hypothetical protein